MERADHATLEQTPEGFDIVGMSVPAHILYSGMVHDLMRIGMAKALIPPWLMERARINRRRTGGFLRGNEQIKY
jgi:hypothetical protein